LEAELEDERKQRTNALSQRKKLEADLKDMEQQLEMHDKIKEDALKQLKKLQVRVLLSTWPRSLVKSHNLPPPPPKYLLCS
jgi:myosin protein heavy chain